MIMIADYIQENELFNGNNFDLIIKGIQKLGKLVDYEEEQYVQDHRLFKETYLKLAIRDNMALNGILHKQTWKDFQKENVQFITLLGLQNGDIYDFMLDLVYSYEIRKNKDINISLKLLRLVYIDEMNKSRMKEWNDFALGAQILEKNVIKLIECLLEIGNQGNHKVQKNVIELLQAILESCEYRRWESKIKKILEYISIVLRDNNQSVDNLLSVMGLLQSSNRLENDIVYEILEIMSEMRMYEQIEQLFYHQNQEIKEQAELTLQMVF